MYKVELRDSLRDKRYCVQTHNFVSNKERKEAKFRA